MDTLDTSEQVLGEALLAAATTTADATELRGQVTCHALVDSGRCAPTAHVARPVPQQHVDRRDYSVPSGNPPELHHVPYGRG